MTPSPLLLHLFLLISAVSAADIPLGSTLYASDPNSKWSSPNDTFALAFTADPTSSARTLVAAITYNNISIWQAGASTNSSAVLRLLPSGDLQLLPTSSSTTPSGRPPPPTSAFPPPHLKNPEILYSRIPPVPHCGQPLTTQLIPSFPHRT
ncbi:UNVERIFIED_CONTAM: hypothetical protein Sangu_2267100 [Sesamum angustifolium]|uniref:Uncharacterized protein n=1 Tax=Sesamum angustifolium TaxID=2727405 RepID=A0AAW2L6W6_9LAMI